MCSKSRMICWLCSGEGNLLHLNRSSAGQGKQQAYLTGCHSRRTAVLNHPLHGGNAYRLAGLSSMDNSVCFGSITALGSNVYW